MNRNLKSYCSSMIPEPYTVLGISLREFSLGHYFLMARFDCGFIDEDPNRMGTFVDFLLAIAICSHTYEGFIEFIKDEKEFNSWCAKWGAAVNKGIRNKQINILDKVMLFKKYMRDGIPRDGDIRYWKSEESDNQKESGAHWSQIIYTTAIGKLGYSQTEALNLPLSRLMWDYFRYCESEGSVELWREDEIIQFEEMEKLNKKELANA